ncbi:morphogenic membrane protein MmpB [Kitasatospora sp. NPDC059571]
MLWSDPGDGPSPEARRVQRMLRRAGPLLAVLAVLAAVLLVR